MGAWQEFSQDDSGMGSTGVGASIPESEAWTLRVLSKHPRKYPERCLRQGPTGSVWVLKGWGETFLCSLAETVSRILSGRGHHFPAPSWRDVGPHSKNFCRALLCLLLAVARLVGRWCFWRLCFPRWRFSLVCGFLVVSFPFLRPPTRRPAVIWRSLDGSSQAVSVAIQGVNY